MIAASLTENEKQVLYRLVAHPRAQDTEISRTLDLGVSTVTKLRNRFLKRGLLKQVNIPDVQRLGAELFAAGYGELNPDVSLDHKLRVGEELMKSARTTFLTAGDGNQAFGFGFSRNYTSAMEEILYTESVGGVCQKNPFEGLNYVFSSFRLAKIFRFFNFAPLLSDVFGINDPKFIEPPLYFPPLPPVHLNTRAKQVLSAMIEHPEKNNRELSHLLGISRQTISVIRKKLIENGLVRAAYIPDIAMLDLEVLTFAHLKLKSNAENRIGIDTIRTNLRHSSLIFSMLHGTDILFIHVATGFTSGKKGLFEAMRMAKNAGILREEPVIFMFPASNIIYQVFHDYSTPLKALFAEEKTQSVSP